ncbi:hypothetical protein [Herbidospora mongoliensis]|uniref:hypothetical protein n=1 Tax=Herbidospora mongoliensis TaxID=688067 RepID=UPI0008334AA3|nr:hypothetical protein [Herbidospora mongoliensis]
MYHQFGFSLNAAFEVAHDPDVPEQGTGVIWTGEDQRDIVPATPAKVTVPGGALEDGWQIRWRVRAETVDGLLVGEWSEWQEATVDTTE